MNEKPRLGESLGGTAAAARRERKKKNQLKHMQKVFMIARVRVQTQSRRTLVASETMSK